MNPSQAGRYLNSLKKFGIRMRLDHIERLLLLLGEPHKKINCIHVAGTNGKGSVCAYINSILLEAGFKVGLYTSPNLYRLNERIKLSNKDISDRDLARLVSVVKPLAEKVSSEFGELTFFEVTTAMALLYFVENKADYVVLEAGLGGRLDATNVVPRPLVTVITNISLDHTDLLGSTIQAIAEEKAAVIKENGLVVTAASGKALEVVENACREKRAVLCVVGDEVYFRRKTHSLDRQDFVLNFFGKEHLLSIQLAGRHQLVNAALAYSVAEMLGSFHKIALPEDRVSSGLLKAKNPCRMELMQKKPAVVLDGAHNPDGIAKLMNALADVPRRKLHLVFGCSFNKDYRKMVSKITVKPSTVFVAETKLAKPLGAEKISTAFAKKYANVHVEKDVRKAVKRAIQASSKDDLVLVTGSLYVAGEARRLWHKKT